MHLCELVEAREHEQCGEGDREWPGDERPGQPQRHGGAGDEKEGGEEGGNGSLLVEVEARQPRRRFPGVDSAGDRQRGNRGAERHGNDPGFEETFHVVRSATLHPSP